MHSFVLFSGSSRARPWQPLPHFCSAHTPTSRLPPHFCPLYPPCTPLPGIPANITCLCTASNPTPPSVSLAPPAAPHPLYYTTDCMTHQRQSMPSPCAHLTCSPLASPAATCTYSHIIPHHPTACAPLTHSLLGAGTRPLCAAYHLRCRCACPRAPM